MNLGTKVNFRVLIAVMAGVLVLALLNWNIFTRERLIENGKIVLLQLAPVDPRSLMQGDYMILNYALTNELEKQRELKDDGILILKLDEQNIARFSRFDDGSAIQDDEVRLRYRVRNNEWRNRVKIATNAFFFEEGQGEIYEPARYGEFRVDDSGDAILTQLRDEELKVLGRSAVLN